MHAHPSYNNYFARPGPPLYIYNTSTYIATVLSVVITQLVVKLGVLEHVLDDRRAPRCEKRRRLSRVDHLSFLIFVYVPGQPHRKWRRRHRKEPEKHTSASTGSPERFLTLSELFFAFTAAAPWEAQACPRRFSACQLIFKKINRS